jgi:hypothetical protein
MFGRLGSVMTAFPVFGEFGGVLSEWGRGLIQKESWGGGILNDA